MTRFRPTLPLALLCLAAAAPAAAEPPATGTLVHLVSEASASAVPDIAEISAGVVTDAAEASAALSANAARMAQVVATLRKAGIAERDIQTSRLSLQPRYRYEKDQEPKLIGYEATNRVTLTLRNLGTAGRVVDTLVAAGANQIDGPRFAIDKPGPLLDRARTDAVRQGRERAELYAAAAGLRVKRIVSISEAGAAPPPMPVRRMALAMDAKEAASPVEAGENELRVSLDMLFELQ